MSGAAIVGVPRTSRVMRRPRHNFYVKAMPWAIAPLAVLPVLPGETLKNILIQGRVLSDPVVSQVAGWWYEQYWFYVKHRHMAMSTVMFNMVLDLNYTVPGSAKMSSDATWWHALSGDMAYVRDVYEAIVNEFFRDAGEDYNTAAGIVGQYRVCHLNLPGWWDSIISTAELDVGGIGDATIGGSTSLDEVGELARAVETYNLLRMQGLTNMEYDDWLRTYGVRVAAPEEDRPELIRYFREWQLPSNQVTVGTGGVQEVSSVLSWNITERADKDRYFKEPGFIMGVQITRPKVYHTRRQAGVGLLQDAWGWQPPFMASSPYTSVRPVHNLAGYVFDTKDLYLHGDQWVYGATPPSVAFPASGRIVYPTDPEIQALFKVATAKHVTIDGVAQFAILGQQGADITGTSR